MTAISQPIVGKLNFTLPLGIPFYLRKRRGTDMSNPLLTLGSFSFEGLESPRSLVLQTKQRLIVHHLGTGAALVDSLGDDYQVVNFSGIFSGKSAASRIRTVDLLRAQGAMLPLIWESQTLTVIIQQFELTYVSAYWVPYKMTCYVQRSRMDYAESEKDLILQSTIESVGNISNILRNFDFVPSNAQVASLTSLSLHDYDVAPPADISTTAALALAIENIDTGYDYQLNTIRSSALDSVDAAAALISGLTTAMGNQAYRNLGLYRINDLVVKSREVR